MREEEWVDMKEGVRYMKVEEIEEKYLDEVRGGEEERMGVVGGVAGEGGVILMDEGLGGVEERRYGNVREWG